MDRNILSLHDRIDEEHFDLHLLKAAVRALQEKVSLLEAQVRELRRDALADEEERNDRQQDSGRIARRAWARTAGETPSRNRRPPNTARKHGGRQLRGQDKNLFQASLEDTA
jgi:hypothetical protein